MRVTYNGYQIKIGDAVIVPDSAGFYKVKSELISDEHVFDSLCLLELYEDLKIKII